MKFYIEYEYSINGRSYHNGTVIEASDETEVREIIYSQAIEKGIEKLQIQTIKPIVFIDSLSFEPVSEYEFSIKRTLTGMKCSYQGIYFTLRRIETKKNNITCDLEVNCDFDITKNSIIWRGNFNITSEDYSSNLAKRFEEALPEKDFGINWKIFVQMFRKRILNYLQQGEPAEDVRQESINNFNPEYLVKPFIIKDMVNLIYGEGGSGKSSLAILFGLLGQSTKLQVDLDLNVEPIKVLYLDYENNKNLFYSFLKQITNSYGIKDFSITYRPCYIPLVLEFENLCEIIDEKEPDLIIIDSLAPATGETVEVSSVISFFQHLNKLQKTILLIGHMAKNSSSETPFGSVYFLNLSRNVFLLKRRFINKDKSQIILVHKKCNISKLYYKPFIFEFDYSKGIRITKSEIEEDIKDCSDKIIEVLKSKACSLGEIAELTGANYITVKTTCKRLHDKGYLVKLKNGKDVLYALKAEEPF